MKERQSNIELLRIISMLMVVLLHANYFTIGAVARADVLAAPVQSFVRMFLEQTCIVAVDVFVLISGWFGIRPSLKGAGSILYQVVFFGLIVLLPALIFHAVIPWKNVIKVFFGGVWYWFIPSYLILYLLAPVLNSFVEGSTSRSLLGVVILFFSAEFIYGWMASLKSFCNGYSIISFIGLYLLARFVNLYSRRLKNFSLKTDIIFFVILTLIPCLIQFFGLYFLNHSFNPRAYSSPFVISASLFLLLGFSKLNFSSRPVNWIASSVFPVYLVTMHPVVVPFFKSSMYGAYQTFGGGLYVLFAILVSVVICIVCVVVDKLCKLTWTWLYGTVFEALFDRCSRVPDVLLDSVDK